MFAEHWEQLKVVAWNSVWATNLATMSPGRAGVVRVVRIFHMLVRELAEGQITMRAGGLVYTTLLSMVPVLAVSFAMLKTFGVHQEFEPALLKALEPLGARAAEAGSKIIDFVENLSVAGLGAMGLAVLLVTIVSLVHKIEQAFNHTWRVGRPRGLVERFSRYLTVVMIGPVLVFTALTIIGSITSDALFQEAASLPAIAMAVDLGGKLVPFALVVTAFTCTYLYMPNARVRLRSAFAGALFAGLVWVVAGWLFAELVVTSARYTAIYRSFALLILFMMWIYIAWVILLVGASFAFYHQHPEYLGLLRHELRPSNRLIERIAVAACVRVARGFLDGSPPSSAEALAHHLRVPLGPLEDVLGVLVERLFLARAGDEAALFLPARDLAQIGVHDVIHAVRRAHEVEHVTGTWLPAEPRADETMAAVEAGIAHSLGALTLRDLAGEPTPVAGASVTVIARDGAS